MFGAPSLKSRLASLSAKVNKCVHEASGSLASPLLPAGAGEKTVAPVLEPGTARELFCEFAQLFNDADAAQDANVKEELGKLRPLLRIQLKKKSALLEKASMIIRLVLTLVAVLCGALCVLAVSPLRILHWPLRCFVSPGYLPLDLATMAWARLIMACAGITVKVKVSPAEVWEKGRAGIIVYNHASNLDAFILMFAGHHAAPKFIGKKILFEIPIFGWVNLAIGNVPINRGDREKAIRTMNEAVASIMKNWNRCVAVSPEGTRSRDGHLNLPFKHGIFHLQDQTDAPLLPVSIEGAFELWPPGRVFTRMGEVTVTALPQQLPVEGERRLIDARIKLQRSFAESASKEAVQVKPLSCIALITNIFVILLGAAVFAGFYLVFAKLYVCLAVGLGIGKLGVLSVALAGGAIATAYVRFVV